MAPSIQDKKAIEQASGPGLSGVAIASLAVPLRHYSDLPGPQCSRDTGKKHDTAMHCFTACLRVPDGFASTACELADAPVHPVIPNLFTASRFELRSFQFGTVRGGHAIGVLRLRNDSHLRLHSIGTTPPRGAVSSRDSISPVAGVTQRLSLHKKPFYVFRPATSTAAPRCRFAFRDFESSQSNLCRLARTREPRARRARRASAEVAPARAPPRERGGPKNGAAEQSRRRGRNVRKTRRWSDPTGAKGQPEELPGAVPAPQTCTPRVGAGGCARRASFLRLSPSLGSPS